MIYFSAKCGSNDPATKQFTEQPLGQKCDIESGSSSNLSLANYSAATVFNGRMKTSAT